MGMVSMLGSVAGQTQGETPKHLFTLFVQNKLCLSRARCQPWQAYYRLQAESLDNANGSLTVVVWFGHWKSRSRRTKPKSRAWRLGQRGWAKEAATTPAYLIYSFLTLPEHLP